MYSEKLEKAVKYGEIFNIVKMAVAERLGLHRAGLSLVLMDLPPNVLGMHQLGSNSIVMDSKILDAVNSGLSSKIERNSYIFVILLHEYLHSFNISSEQKVRDLVIDVVEFSFGKGHPTHNLARNPLSLFGNIPITIKRSPSEPSIIRDFDRESMPFIG